MKNSTPVDSNRRLPTMELDSSLYEPLPEELEFLKQQTRIEDEEELKQHVISVQKEAWRVVNYVCIQKFMFINMKIASHPSYQSLLAIGKKRPGAIHLDLGCCFGNDIRKAIADGYPMENCVASDIKQEFWDLGHKLYRSTPETFTVPFIAGDVFDPKHIAPAPPTYSTPSTPRPVLSTLTSLTPLQGHVSAIHTAQFFHLFDKDQQIALAHSVASLLSPEPGSMILGSHSTKEKSGYIYHDYRRTKMWCFGPSDWEKLWKEIFSECEIEVETKLHKPVREAPQTTSKGNTDHVEERSNMEWCVRRL